MNQQELVKIAKDLGFESKLIAGTPWKYSNREDLRRMMWLIQLRQYVFETWKVYIAVTFLRDNLFEYNFRYVLDNEFHEDESKLSYNTEIEALHEGLSYFLGNMGELS